MATKDTKSETQEKGFDGVSIVKSRKYKRYADILCLVLDEDKLYTHEQVNRILKTALSKPVQEVVNH